MPGPPGGRAVTPRWARRAYASRRSGWALNRPRRLRELREHQAALATTGGPCWRVDVARSPEAAQAYEDLTAAVRGAGRAAWGQQ